MFVETNGIRIYVEEQGKGAPTLVFLHYWGGSSRTWKDVIDSLPGSYHTVAPDHRGWGDSEAPDSGYYLKDFAADLAGVVAALDLQSYVLVGHSMGGKIAQLVASRRPRGLAGIVLVAPAQPVPMNIPDEALSFMRGAYLSRESVNAAIDHVLTAKPLSAAHRQQVIADSLRGAPQAREAWPTYTAFEDISSDVAAITVPTIAIVGELDPVDGADLQAELLPRIRHAKLHVVPGTGHLTPLEAPAEIARLIHGFASELDLKSAQPKTPEQFPVAFDTAFNARDVDGVLATLTADATMRMTDGTVITGRENMREHFVHLLNSAKLHIRNEVRRVLQSGDIALLLLDWTLNITLPNGEKVVESGTATQVLERGADAIWRLRVSNPLGLN